MAIRDIIPPKSRNEIIQNLENLSLDSALIKLIRENDLAYQFISGFLSSRNASPAEKVKELNGLAEIIRSLRYHHNK